MITGKKDDIKQLIEYLNKLLDDKKDLERGIQERIKETKKRASMFSTTPTPNEYYEKIIRDEEKLLNDVRKTVNNYKDFINRLEKSYRLL